MSLAMPRLGMAMQEGTILRWLKEEGEEVAQDEVLLVIETDKVEIDVPSPWTGVVVELLAQEGDVVPVIQPIARIRDAMIAGRTAEDRSMNQLRRRIPLRAVAAVTVVV